MFFFVLDYPYTRSLDFNRTFESGKSELALTGFLSSGITCIKEANVVRW